MTIDIDRIRRILLEEEVLDQLSQAHIFYEADEEEGYDGWEAGEKEAEEAFKRAADLEYVINWLRPGSIGPAFPDEWIAEWRRKKRAAANLAFVVREPTVVDLYK